MACSAKSAWQADRQGRGFGCSLVNDFEGLFILILTRALLLDSCEITKDSSQLAISGVQSKYGASRGTTRQKTGKEARPPDSCRRTRIRPPWTGADETPGCRFDPFRMEGGKLQELITNAMGQHQA